MKEYDNSFVLITLRTLPFAVWHFVRDLSLDESLSLQKYEDNNNFSNSYKTMNRIAPNKHKHS